MVGSVYGYTLVTQELVNELVFIDINKDSAKAQAADILEGTSYLGNQPKVYAGEYSDCADADIICVTAGMTQKEGQSRLELVQANTNIMKNIIKEIKATSFNGVLLIASNPVDIMTYVAQKESGYPVHKVVGSGTTLDTSRLRVNLGNYLGYNPSDINAYMIGEHGDSSVPVWSRATIGQKTLLEVVNSSNGKYTLEGLNKCYEDARDAAYHIIKGKGSTYFGIGVSLTKITRAIFGNQNVVLPCSTLLDGEYGQNDVSIAVPVLINKDGVVRIEESSLDDDEMEKFTASVNKLKEIISGLEI